jgi:single-stranded DNA-specific DHH superfamily exonuclease
MKDMEESSRELEKQWKWGKIFSFFGDYDVDGVTAVSFLLSKNLLSNVATIPDRYDGMNFI